MHTNAWWELLPVFSLQDAGVLLGEHQDVGHLVVACIAGPPLDLTQRPPLSSPAVWLMWGGSWPLGGLGPVL